MPSDLPDPTHQHPQDTSSDLISDPLPAPSSGSDISQVTHLLQKALMAMQEEKWAEVIPLFDEVAKQARQADQPQIQKQAQQAAQVAHVLLEQSKSSLAVGDPTDLDLEQLGEQFEGSVADLSLALHHLTQTLTPYLDPLEQVELYCNRAKLNTVLGQRAQASEDWQQATAIATASGIPEVLERVQTYHRVMQQAEAFQETNLDPYSSLLEQIRQLGGSLPVAGDVQLQMAIQALQANNYTTCLQLAEEARQAALESNDEIHCLRYLYACVLIAFAQEGLNHRPEVIAILLTCKNTLERQHLPEMAEQILLLLNGLETRWGKEGLWEARLAYRQAFSSMSTSTLK
jgi:hypothetical protein